MCAMNMLAQISLFLSCSCLWNAYIGASAKNLQQNIVSDWITQIAWNILIFFQVIYKGEKQIGCSKKNPECWFI